MVADCSIPAVYHPVMRRGTHALLALFAGLVACTSGPSTPAPPTEPAVQTADVSIGRVRAQQPKWRADGTNWEITLTWEVPDGPELEHFYLSSPATEGAARGPPLARGIGRPLSPTSVRAVRAGGDPHLDRSDDRRSGHRLLDRSGWGSPYRGTPPAGRDELRRRFRDHGPNLHICRGGPLGKWRLPCFQGGEVRAADAPARAGSAQRSLSARDQGRACDQPGSRRGHPHPPEKETAGASSITSTRRVDPGKAPAPCPGTCTPDRSGR